MSAGAITSPRHGTRWGRTALVSVIGFGAIVGMTMASAEHVLGFDANLVVMNGSTDNDLNGMSISTSRLQASDAGFGMAPMKMADGSWKNVLRAGFGGAMLSGLCLSKTEKIPVLGTTYTFRLLSPSTNTITANNGVFDVTDFEADASSTGISLAGSIQVGLATGDITTVSTNGGAGTPYQSDPFGQVPSGNSPLEIYNSSVYTAASNLGNWVVDGKPHTFSGGWTGIDTATADLKKVAGRLWSVQLSGAITMPKLSLSITSGNADLCATWPTPPPYTNTKSFP